MPTRDEDGNLIGLDAFPIALRGDDAREFILPESKFDLTAASEDPEEHDCLPPMENTGSWTLAGEGFKKLMEVIDGIIHSLEGLTFTMVHIGSESRHHRKVVRWDERNRRRRLKGLSEKPCPYPRTWKTTIEWKEETPDDGSAGNNLLHPGSDNHDNSARSSRDIDS